MSEALFYLIIAFIKFRQQQMKLAYLRFGIEADSTVEPLLPHSQGLCFFALKQKYFAELNHIGDTAQLHPIL